MKGRGGTPPRYRRGEVYKCGLVVSGWEIEVGEASALATP